MGRMRLAVRPKYRVALINYAVIRHCFSVELSVIELNLTQKTEQRMYHNQ